MSKAYPLNKLRQAWGAGRSAANPTSARDPLVGKWFHSYLEDGTTIRWQGQILAALPNSTYLIELYEWFFGSPNGQQMVTFSDMAHWKFYDSNDEMNQHYAIYSKRDWERRLREKGRLGVNG